MKRSRDKGHRGLRIILLTLATTVVSLVMHTAPALADTWNLPAAILSDGTKDAESVEIATGADGTTAVVWTRNNFADYYMVQVRIRRPGGDFEAVKTISQSRAPGSDVGANAIKPQVAVSPNGTVTVIWLRQQQAFLGSSQVFWQLQARTDPGPGITAPDGFLPIDDFDTTVDENSDLDLVAGSDGRVTAFWTRPTATGRILMSKVRPADSTSFDSEPPASAISPDGQIANDPTAVAGPGGKVVVAWERTDATSVMAASRNPGLAEFSNASAVSFPTVASTSPDVAIGPDGRATLVWVHDVAHQAARVAAATQDSFNGFPSIELLSGAAGRDAGGPQVAVTSEGTRVVSWELIGTESEPMRLVLRSQPSGGSWSATEDLSPVDTLSRDAELAADPFGGVVAVWTQNDVGVPNHIRTRTMDRGGEFGPSTQLSSAGGTDTAPRLAIQPDGSPVAAWLKPVDSTRYAVESASGEPPRFSLTIERSGSSGGSVTSAPSGIACGTECEVDFVAGTLVTLTANPDEGSAFAGWDGACSGRSPVCQVAIDQARDVTANFEPGHPLTVIRSGEGSGTVISDPQGIQCGEDCQFSFVLNETVTLTAAPEPGSVFTGWDGDCSGQDPTCQVTIDQSLDVTADFEPGATLTVGRTGTGSGSITSSPAGINCGGLCEADFELGTLVTLTAEPATGSMFTGWSGACSGQSLTCEVSILQARNVSASFALSALVTVERQGSGAGKITSFPSGIECGAVCERQFLRGTIVTLTATADPDNTFTGWTGDCSGEDRTCQVTANQAKSVTAAFEPGLELKVSRTGSGAGTVSSIPSGIACGSTCRKIFTPDVEVNLTATSSLGSRFNGWSGDCAGAANTCQVTMDEAKNVTANFIRQYTLQTNTLGSGSGSIESQLSGIDCGEDCEAVLDDQTTVDLEAKPGPGSYLKNWSGSCSGKSLTCSFQMDRDRSVAATFEPGFYLSVSRSGPGMISSSPAGILCGTSCTSGFATDTVVTLAATPDSGTRFIGWSGACSGSSLTCQATIDQAREVNATFEPIPNHTVSLKITGNGQGTVTSEPAGIDCATSCETSLIEGTTVTLNATPSNGSRFIGWSGACEGQQSACKVTIDAALDITAEFSRFTPNFCPARKLDSGQVKLNRRKGTATIKVRTGGAGQVALQPTGQVRKSTTRTSRNGHGSLVVRPRGKAVRKLRKTGKATVKIKLTFRPGTACRGVTKTRVLTLRKNK